MLFLEAMKTVVELAIKEVEKSNHATRGNIAVSIINKWLNGGDARKLQAIQQTPLTVIFHPTGDIEFTGVTAKEIVIDDRRP